VPLHAHPGNIYVVMTENGHLVATATVMIGQVSQKSFVQVEDFIVHPAHRRQGHGRDLLTKILLHFDQGDRYFFAHVEVHPSRTEMISLLSTTTGFVQRAKATSREDGAVHVFRRNFFDPQ
jgi:ribosomal protein S18 acetylase RimI-like enzyme